MILCIRMDFPTQINEVGYPLYILRVHTYKFLNNNVLQSLNIVFFLQRVHTLMKQRLLKRHRVQQVRLGSHTIHGNIF